MTEIATLVEQPTEAEIARHYSAAMDSVNLINGDKPESMNDAEWTDCLERNREHLKIMLAKPWWTDQDLQPLRQASEE
jgi:hypothetical protein